MINNDNPSGTRKRLDVDQRFIWRPDISGCGWKYSHHPFITIFKGMLFATFSSGIEKEDRPYQRVMLSTSADYINWSSPVALFESIEARNRPGVLTPAGFHLHGGQLVCYAGLFEHDDEATRTGIYKDKPHSYANLYAKTTSDGILWSEEIDLELPVLPNHGPQELKSGRLLFSGNFTFPFTDDSSGLSGFQMGGIYPFKWDNFMDTPYGHTVNTRNLNCGTALSEGSFFQTDDSVIHMLLRSLSGNLWLTESSDNAVPWSYPVESRFSDCSSKFHFGSIGNTFYCVSNPDKENRRIPLVLSLSEDGENFNRQYIIADTEPQELSPPVISAEKIYGYPHTCIHDGYLYIITSVCKTAIMVFRIKISDFL